MKRKRFMIAIAGLAFGLACGCTCTIHEEARTVSEIAFARKTPAGAPKYSDVCMRSLFPRPNRWIKEGQKPDPHDTLKTAEAFAVTRLEWVYTRNDKDFAQQCQDAGIHYNGTLITEASMSSIKGHQVDLDGQYVTRWTKHGQGCANNPDYLEYYVSQARPQLGIGVGGFQVDNTGLNNAAKCYCEHCITGFRSYLKANVPDNEWKTLAVGDMATFDYRQYLLKKEEAKQAAGALSQSSAARVARPRQPISSDHDNVRRERTTVPEDNEEGYRWAKDGQTLDMQGADIIDPSKRLRELYVRFQVSASVNFHIEAREAINKAAGRRVPMSCNNGSGGWGPVQRVFDYGIGELRSGESNPWHLRHAFLEAAEQGKHQVLSMPKPNCGTPLTRRVIATAYANGGQMMVPWDIFQGPTSRYYGKPERYADLFHFVRNNVASEEAMAVFTAPVKPATPPTLATGLNYAFYEKHTHSIPRAYGSLKASGIAPGFDLSARTRDRSYAFQFTGYIDIPRSGIYTFHLKSDDGSRLTISGREVVDNDYIRDEPMERSGTVALARGKHPMKLEYFVWISKPHLELYWEGPGIDQQPVPTSAYFHAK